MFRIGDFSRLTQVTVKALRHYDSLGLLKPAQIDPESGYRYYSGSQLPRLNRILALKDLGFSLEQIGQLLDADLSPEQLRVMLQAKQDEVREQIEAEQTRLLRIEARLQQIAEGTISANYDVVLKSVDAQPVASLRGLIPTRNAIGQLFRELTMYQQKHQIHASSMATIWHETEFYEQGIDAEATIATDDPVPAEGRVVGRVLPAVEHMATVIHHGSPSNIGDGCQALLKWIEANGYQLEGPERVVLLQRGGADWSNTVAELQYPVTPRD
ncbi:MAG: MerR family transcriptional regulator [Nitrolancea sp.]